MAGSRQAATLQRTARAIPDLKVVEVGQGTNLDLLEKLGNRQIDIVAIDESVEDIANQYVPNLRATLPLGDSDAGGLAARPASQTPNSRRGSTAFIERVQHDGTLARLEDRYLGHVRRLNQPDIVKFLGEIETTLPKFRKYFQAAQALTGLDWRLIAAIAYHESHWDPNATSYTNVRGIMMLTEETADRLEVSNRLDPSESILAGARYVNLLKEQLPEDVAEPDRTWLALAGYNIGPGHLNTARTLARQLKADPNAWYDMKGILPKLAQPKYLPAAENRPGTRRRGGHPGREYPQLLRHPAAQRAALCADAPHGRRPEAAGHRSRGAAQGLCQTNNCGPLDFSAGEQTTDPGLKLPGRKHPGLRRQRPSWTKRPAGLEAFGPAETGSARGDRTSRPPMYGRRTAGMVTLPSACWLFSRMATSVRPTARPEPFRVWQSSGLFLSLRKRACMRRAWKAPKLEQDEISR
jgi:soluble lytic murein transglycosylase-like protein